MFKFLLATLLLAAASAAPKHRNNVRLEPNGQGRIVGGNVTDISEAPYQVSLLYYGSHICGGTIISPIFIVTAAHCTDGDPASAYSIRAGSSSRTSGGVVVQVQTLYQNPRYDDWIIDFDISILRLQTALQYGPTIDFAVLPGLNEYLPAGTDVLVTGWGTLVENGNSLPTALQGVIVQIVSLATCRVNYYLEELTNNMLCAGVTGGGKDACQGDSGGPLVIDGTKTLVGIVSWGYGCARSEYPGVYSSVPALRGYVEEITGL